MATGRFGSSLNSKIGVTGSRSQHRLLHEVTLEMIAIFRIDILESVITHNGVRSWVLRESEHVCNHNQALSRHSRSIARPDKCAICDCDTVEGDLIEAGFKGSENNSTVGVLGNLCDGYLGAHGVRLAMLVGCNTSSPKAKDTWRFKSTGLRDEFIRLGVSHVISFKGVQTITAAKRFSNEFWKAPSLKTSIRRAVYEASKKTLEAIQSKKISQTCIDHLFQDNGWVFWNKECDNPNQGYPH